MPRPGRRAFAAFLLALVSAGALLIAPASPAAAAPVQIQLLAINDFHGRLEADATAAVPGAAKVAAVIEAESALLPTGFAAAGDLVGASPFISAAAQDQPTIDVLNAMGLDVSSVGNHEFDKGFDDLKDRIIPAADWAYLGANVYKDGTRALDPYYVEDIGGVDVGYVGVVTEQTSSLVSPTGIVGVEFRDPVAEAETVAAQLKDGNEANGEADVVVVLTHEGAGPDNVGSIAAISADPVFGEFVAMSADVDAIFSAHTHQAYAFDIPVPGTQRTRPVLSAQEYGKKVGKTVLTVDPATGSITVDSVGLIDPTGYTADPEIAALVQQAKDASAPLGAPNIGRIEADINRGGTPPGSNRGVESPLGNFVADALLAGTSAPNRGAAELAFMNPGGLRDDFRFAASSPLTPGDAEGVVTYGEAFAVQSFSNDVVTKTYTGAQIKAILEEQWQPDGASRPILWLGVSEGFTYTYDPAAPRGSHVNPGSIRLNGVRINPNDPVRVTVNSFLAAGGDNFTTLGGGTGSFTTGDNDLAVLRAYFESFLPGVTPVDREPRSFVAAAGSPDLVPFDSAADAVDELFAAVAGRTPSAAERTAWVNGITDGSRTITQLVLELQNVDVRSPAAQVTRIYLGLFGRGPDDAGLAFWVEEMANGRSINSVAAFFARSSEFRALYGDTTNEQFVDLVYENVLGRAPDAAGRAFWLGELGRGVPRHRMFLLFSESAEFRTQTLTAMKIIDLHLAMLGRTPSPAELDSLWADVDAGELTLSDIIDTIRFSREYAQHVAD